MVGLFKLFSFVVLVFDAFPVSVLTSGVILLLAKAEVFWGLFICLLLFAAKILRKISYIN